MRLWHKSILPHLPQKQLVSQWRECCCIARSIYIKGTPNHILVNPIMNYPEEHLNTYAMLVYNEMKRRGQSVEWNKFKKWRNNLTGMIWNSRIMRLDSEVDLNDIFSGWHDLKYLDQCLMNLQEKHDRGGIDNWEWHRIVQYCHDNYNFTVLNLYDD